VSTILIDGYNLGLEKGTGVATYARNLSYELGALGYSVDVLYGNRSNYARDPLLREISFFDPSANERNKLLEILEQAEKAVHGPLTFKARQVPVTGKVITDTAARARSNCGGDPRLSVCRKSQTLRIGHIPFRCA